MSDNTGGKRSKSLDEAELPPKKRKICRDVKGRMKRHRKKTWVRTRKPRPSVAQDDVKVNGPRVTDIDIGVDSRRQDTDISWLRQINKITSRAATIFNFCKTCLHRRPTCCVNLACGHVTNCSECAPTMLKCAECSKDITGTRPLYDKVKDFLACKLHRTEE